MAANGKNDRDSSSNKNHPLRSFLLGKYGECSDEFFQTVESASEFNTGLNENDYSGMTLDSYRRIQNKRAKMLAEYSFIENANVIENPVCGAAFCDAMSFIEWSAAMKYFLNRSVCYIYYILLNSDHNLLDCKLSSLKVDFHSSGKLLQQNWIIKPKLL